MHKSSVVLFKEETTESSEEVEKFPSEELKMKKEKKSLQCLGIKT